MLSSQNPTSIPMSPLTSSISAVPSHLTGGLRKDDKSVLDQSFKGCQTDVFLLGLYDLVQLWRQRLQALCGARSTDMSSSGNIPTDEGAWELLFCNRLMDIGQRNAGNYTNLLHRYWRQRNYCRSPMAGFGSSSSKQNPRKSGCCGVLLKRLWKQHDSTKGSEANSREAMQEKNYMKVGIMMLTLDPAYRTSSGFFAGMDEADL